MKVGMLTAPFADETLEDVMDFAESASIPCLEIISNPGSKHLNPVGFTKKKAEKLNEELSNRMLEISALAYYTLDITDPKKVRSVQAHAKRVINAAALLGLDTVCMLPGAATPGMTKLETIQQVLPKAFRPILTHARKKHVRIALENCYVTCLQGLDTFEAMFYSIPDEDLGLNYDPSHLYHQGCDHLVPISQFKDRIFHVHAKDTLINQGLRAKVGIYSDDWWRYVIPGFGNINWGEFVSHLRINGYNGVLSIEHEDLAQGREEGFLRGAWHLEQFC